VSLYAGIAAAAMCLASAGAAFWYGVGVGDDRVTAQIAREDKVVQLATDAAAAAAAEAISKIEVKHVTLTQQTQTLVREKLVYSTCRNDVGVMRNINEARTGRPESAGEGELPAASAPGR
jgi:hypothetical protein